MLLSKAFLMISLLQQVSSVPLTLEPLVFLPSFLSHLQAKEPSHASLFTRHHASLFERGVFPAQCADDAAGEAQGCFTLQDASNKNVRLALSPGQSFVTDGGLGEGSFGKVAQCVLKDGQDVAVKQYRAAGTPMRDNSFNLLKELEGNKYIVKVIARGKIQDRPSLAMELAKDDDLAARTKKGAYKGKEKEQAMKDVGNQLLDGFAYMHSKRIAHRDLYENNVAFQGDTAKIIDFDFACKDKECITSVPGGDFGGAAPGKWRTSVSTLRH